MAAPTITSIGTYTTQITLNQSTFVQLKDAVKNAMTGLSIASGTTFSNGGTTGWDLVWEGKYNVLSPHWTQVFRSLNVDGVTYKCSIFNWNIPNNELDICTCERFGTLAEFTAGTLSAMATTGGAITNPAWTFYNCATIGWKLDACDVIINAHPRWMLAHAYINSEPCLWAGVFEIQRNDPLDTAVQSNPCWGWIGSTLWHLGINTETLTTLTGANTALSNSGQHLIMSMPSVMKYTGRVTGINAALDFTADYGVTQHPSWVHMQYGSGYYMCTFTGLIGNTNAKFQFNGWNPTKRMVMPITLISDYRSAGPVVLGQIYGIKVLGPVADNMNRIQLNVGSDGNFSSSGTNKDHFVLNVHHKHYFPSNVTADFIVRNPLGNIPSDAYPNGEIISIGSAYFVLTRNNQRVYKVDAFSGATTLVANMSYTTYSMRFDGEGYIYVCHSGGIGRINVYTLEWIERFTTSATRGITFLNGYIVFQNTNGVVTTSPTFYKLQLSNRTETTFGSSSTSSPYSVHYASGETDFYGNVTFAGSSYGSWTSTAYYVPVRSFNSSGTEYVFNYNQGPNSSYLADFSVKLITDTVVSINGGYGSSSYGTGGSGYGCIFDSVTRSYIYTYGMSTHFGDTTYGPPPVFKHIGRLYCFSRYSNTTGYTYWNAIGMMGTGSTYYSYYTGGTSTSGVLNISTLYNTAICCDGARIITAYTNAAGGYGLRTLTGWTGKFTYTGVQLGQVAILA